MVIVRGSTRVRRERREDMARQDEQGQGHKPEQVATCLDCKWLRVCRLEGSQALCHLFAPDEEGNA